MTSWRCGAMSYKTSCFWRGHEQRAQSFRRTPVSVDMQYYSEGAPPCKSAYELWYVIRVRLHVFACIFVRAAKSKGCKVVRRAFEFAFFSLFNLKNIHQYWASLRVQYRPSQHRQATTCGILDDGNSKWQRSGVPHQDDESILRDGQYGRGNERKLGHVYRHITDITAYGADTKLAHPARVILSTSSIDPADNESSVASLATLVIGTSDSLDTLFSSSQSCTVNRYCRASGQDVVCVVGYRVVILLIDPSWLWVVFAIDSPPSFLVNSLQPSSSSEATSSPTKSKTFIYEQMEMLTKTVKKQEYWLAGSPSLTACQPEANMFSVMDEPFIVVRLACGEMIASFYQYVTAIFSFALRNTSVLVTRLKRPTTATPVRRRSIMACLLDLVCFDLDYFHGLSWWFPHISHQPDFS